MASGRLMICAGEASGDWLAGQLVSQLQQQRPTLQCFGMGGRHARSAGMRLAVDIDHLPGMGLTEWLCHFPTIHRAFSHCCALMTDQSPDAIVLIDYPGFNLRLARIARERNIPVIYYVGPKLWAWGKKRMAHIQRDVSQMAVILPFEVPLYQKANVPVADVGHPLCQTLAQKPKRPIPKNPSIAILPGSRPHEINRMMPVFVQCMQQWLQTHPYSTFLIPKSPNLSASIWEPYTSLNLPITWHTGEAHSVLATADVGWITSGTASLEAALIGTPHIVCYKVSALTAWYFKHRLTIDHISLPNLILDKAWLPELLQEAANAANIIHATERFIQPSMQPTHQANIEALWQALSGNKTDLLEVIKPFLP